MAPAPPTRRMVVYTIVVFVILASLDNTAIALIPSMIGVTAAELGTSEGSVAFATGSAIFMTAVAAVGWGYLGDRSQRKSLLVAGTLIWAAGTALTATSQSIWSLVGWQLITAVGLGSIASVGFSVIADFVSPRRRGLAMSFWGLSQGVGTLVGTIVASQLGAGSFRRPLVIIAIAGVVAAAAYIVTFDPPRGYSEPELARAHAAGTGYEYTIDRSQIPQIFARRTNVWLMLQGLSAQVAYGSLIWVTFLYQEKVQAAGYDLDTATRVGGIFAAIFSFGALFSIVAGALGDRWQLRTLRARAILSAVGIVGAIPFFLTFFFLPMRGLEVTPGAGFTTLVGEVLANIIGNPWVGGVFVASILALALTSADSPNWFALISDVNVPEHRGTVFGLGNMANGVGRSVGNVLTGVVGSGLERALAPPWNWAVGLAVFQVFFLPTGYCYFKASETSPGDITEVRDILRERAANRV